MVVYCGGFCWLRVVVDKRGDKNVTPVTRRCDETPTRIPRNPYPHQGVGVSTGMGAGCPGKPQGSPLHSLLETLNVPANAKTQPHQCHARLFVFACLSSLFVAATVQQCCVLPNFAVDQRNRGFLIRYPRDNCKEWGRGKNGFFLSYGSTLLDERNVRIDPKR